MLNFWIWLILTRSHFTSIPPLRTVRLLHRSTSTAPELVSGIQNLSCSYIAQETAELVWERKEGKRGKLFWKLKFLGIASGTDSSSLKGFTCTSRSTAFKKAKFIPKLEAKHCTLKCYLLRFLILSSSVGTSSALNNLTALSVKLGYSSLQLSQRERTQDVIWVPKFGDLVF